MGDACTPSGASLDFLLTLVIPSQFQSSFSPIIDQFQSSFTIERLVLTQFQSSFSLVKFNSIVSQGLGWTECQFNPSLFQFQSRFCPYLVQACPGFKPVVALFIHFQSSFSPHLVQAQSRCSSVLVQIWSYFNPILVQFFGDVVLFLVHQFQPSLSAGFSPVSAQFQTRFKTHQMQPTFCSYLQFRLSFSPV